MINSVNIELTQYLSLELQHMDQLIDHLLQGKHLIKIISDHLIYSGGKRLRPSITILVAKLFGYHEGKSHINLATAIEFIHTATLLHDDVVDESNLRRGKQTSNNIWGNQASILVGDYLLSQAFCLMTREQNLQILQILSSASAMIAEGEVLQLSVLSDFSITEDRYMEIIQAKTAALFAAAASVGAVIAKQPEQTIEDLHNFGLNLGIAFQMIDDIIDYSSSSNQMGKEAGDDFREGKITLPILISYIESDDDDKKLLEKLFTSAQKTPEEFEIVKEIIDRNNSVHKCLIKAQYYISQAKSHLISYPESKEKQLLLDLLDFALKRIY